MIRLYTGRPGTGKTLKAVSDLVAAIEASEKEKDIDKKRNFYSDINGLKIDGVLPSPDDWRDTPEGSTIIYDEAQLRNVFAANRGASKEQIVRDLTIHRHGNRDIWFITQMPRLLHNDVLDVTNEHIHLVRPYGANLASCYFWRQVEKTPDGRTAKDRAENNYIFNYRKDLYKYYNSAVEHTVKLKLPKKLFIMVGALIVIIGLIMKFAMSSETDKFINPEKAAAEQQAKIDEKLGTPKKGIISDNVTPVVVGGNQQTPTTLTPTQSSNSDNVKPVTVNGSSKNDSPIFNPVTGGFYENPLLAPVNAMMKGNACVAFNMNGNRLNSVSNNDCMYLLNNAGMLSKVN
ncbi:zonular occludens toxin domain-containing protein [Psychrobacter sp. NPDC078501]|uniref:zonular occludens toxin domain-containing protein n=1 Tax=Psychrobacter sp. NPDC078501 TaxID=3364495 RepID=UPI00384C333B